MNRFFIDMLHLYGRVIFPLSGNTGHCQLKRFLIMKCRQRVDGSQVTALDRSKRASRKTQTYNWNVLVSAWIHQESDLLKFPRSNFWTVKETDHLFKCGRWNWLVTSFPFYIALSSCRKRVSALSDQPKKAIKFNTVWCTGKHALHTELEIVVSPLAEDNISLQCF